ncbi:MAG: glycine dehydrogenase (aminomethyl-transferring), partial [Leptolyngbyaceae cyanobacterium SM2_5_2]|nr:glycine dehydrogenase (aminomethyl-transferring) [Leptolyngbyaceae cyanobacterium SM2_5_2]
MTQAFSTSSPIASVSVDLGLSQVSPQNNGSTSAAAPLSPFVGRHLGPTEKDTATMLAALGYTSLAELMEATIPAAIRLNSPLDLPAGLDEATALAKLRALACQNQVWRSYLGLGYANTITPPVIQRNVLENPGWYTQYTPYQPEIAQGRLEALLNFQTLVTDLTGMDIANASLLDEGTAAAEAMTLAFNARKKKQAKAFWVSAACHPQTIDVVKTRALPLGIDVVVGDHRTFSFDTSIFGVLLQYPAT